MLGVGERDDLPLNQTVNFLRARAVSFTPPLCPSQERAQADERINQMWHIHISKQNRTGLDQ